MCRKQILDKYRLTLFCGIAQHYITHCILALPTVISMHEMNNRYECNGNTFDLIQTTLRRVFEKVRQYFGAQSESIPMSFVLGFYVSLVVKRWWEQYKLLPWPDTLALFISAGIPGAVSKVKTRQVLPYHTYVHVDFNHS